jgi:hypothetical protein
MNLEEFLTKNGVHFEKFLEENARKLWRVYEQYDEFIARFAIYEGERFEAVNAKDIIGLSDYLIEEPGILDNFTVMFNPYGDTYHSRANGMLEYSSDDVVRELEGSFRKEPIALSKIGDKYFLGGNGNHRIHLLLMHYLMDKSKGVDAESTFVFPADVKKLDKIKTYVNYIGSLLWDEKFKVNNEYDVVDFSLTGRSAVSYHGETIVLTDDQLLEFLKERLTALKDLDEDYYIDAIEGMWNRYHREESNQFKDFIQIYLPELEDVLKIENFNELRGAIQSNLLGGVSYGNN